MTEADRETVRRQRHQLERLLTAVADTPDQPFPSNLSDEEVINALAQYLDLEPSSGRRSSSRTAWPAAAAHSSNCSR